MSRGMIYLSADKGVIANMHGQVLIWKDQSGNGNDLYAGGISEEFLAKCVKPKVKPKRLFGGKRRANR